MFSAVANYIDDVICKQNKNLDKMKSIRLIKTNNTFSCLKAIKHRCTVYMHAVTKNIEKTVKSHLSLMIVDIALNFLFLKRV